MVGSPKQSFFSVFQLDALNLVALQATRADVVVFDLTVFHKRDLLNICLEGTLGFAVRVAYVVTCRLTFSTNTANSRHRIVLPRGEIFSAFKTHGLARALNKTMIPFLRKKSNEIHAEKDIFFCKCKKFFSRTLAK